MTPTAEEQTIELDCAPMKPRPDTYIDHVLEGTGLKAGEPVSKFFGNWVWAFPDVTPEKWEEVQKIVEPRITALYNCGAIRYGSW